MATKKTSDNNIKTLRKKLGLTAKMLGKATNLDTYTIYKYEWGIKQLGNASFVTITKLCKALSCKPSDLFNDTNTQKYLKEMGM